ncbi:MAG TPA: ABC transporter substrate-binding protein [Pseudolabrys sp.]|nr:ABC transporter substrate-binding protein [Pseudolabrys sp.]
MHRSIRKLGLLAALASAALIAIAPASAEPLKLRVGYDSIPTHLAPIIFKMPDQTKYFDKDYSIDFIRFKGSSLQLQALAADQVDVAVLAFSTFATGILNAHLPIKGIADVAQDGPSFSTVFGVVDSSPIKSIKDLKGQTIAVNALGGAIDMAARSALRKNGLTPDRDVRIIEAGFGAMEAMTRENKVQVGSFLAPFWSKAQKNGGMRALFHQKDGMGTTQFLLFAAKEDYIKAHRDVLVKFLADYVRGIHVVHDPANRPRVLKIMAELTSRPENSFSEWALLPGKDTYHDPHGLVNEAALQSNIDTLAELKMIPKSFDVRAHIDNSLVQDAAKGM